ncbi:MAG TPA: hypothetical protein VE338_07415 [Ktedonobacterales bacterium]|nr:hypothetical protein [Ktedonobacterales bacterium]
MVFLVIATVVVGVAVLHGSWLARRRRTYDHDTLLAAVDSVPAHATLIDPGDPCFLAPERMSSAINAYLRLSARARPAAPRDIPPHAGRYAYRSAFPIADLSPLTVPARKRPVATHFAW